LSAVAEVEPQNGPVWVGLAEIARARGDKRQALRLFQQALAREWPAQEESRRRSAQLERAALLSDTGRRSEAVSLLLSMIEQHGDDPAIGKKAAGMVKAVGSPEHVEEAYAALATRFPADGSVWLGLGDARLAAGKDVSALDAYRRAVNADPDNSEALRGVARVEEVLRLDPTRRGLSVRERARRWNEILQRVVAVVARCGSTQQLEKAKSLLMKRAITLEMSDQKMEAALSVWRGASAPCKTDAVLAHIMSKLVE
jgi:tetratricopeptide (TPR) repeat protein